jgi:hypothetical protein
MQSLDLSGWTPSPHPLDPTYEILTAADELPDEWLEARGVGPRSATTPTFEDIGAGTLAEIVRTHDVTHRDIRPDNLFWLDGHRVIGDLGIAHHADSAGLTEVGIKAGSWGYLPLPGEAASALFQVVSQRCLKTSIVLTTAASPPGARYSATPPSRRHARPAPAPLRRAQPRRRLLPTT